MNLLAQVSDLAPALTIVALVGGAIALFIAIKVGQVLIGLLFVLVGLTLLGGGVWQPLNPQGAPSGLSLRTDGTRPL